MLLVTGGVGIMSMNAPRVYRSTATLFVSLNSGRTVTDLNQGSTFAQSQMLSFGRLAQMPIVLDPVIARLGLSMTSKDLAKSVSASAPANQFMMDVSATSGSAQLAHDIANAVASQLSTAIQKVSPVTTDGDSTVQAPVVDPADVPQYPIAPNTKRNVMAAGFASLLLGLLAAVLRDVLDTRVRAPEDVDSSAGVAVLGRVSGKRSARRGKEIRVMQADGPKSEDFRRLRTNMQMIGRVDETPVFVFSSAIPGEGKSYCATHVALAFAAADVRVLLIDADLRRPTVATYLGIGGNVGLTECLLGRAEFADLRQEYGPRLSVLTSGAIPPNPAELLSSRTFEDLVGAARREFDVVIIDTPPLLPVADAVVVSRVATGVVVVVDVMRTRRNQLAQAVESVRLGGGKVVGAVLNRTKSLPTSAYSYSFVPPSGEPLPQAAPRTGKSIGEHGRPAVIQPRVVSIDENPSESPAVASGRRALD
jgi:capsular exopolysaccharide synthesis family protein